MTLSNLCSNFNSNISNINCKFTLYSPSKGKHRTQYTQSSLHVCCSKLNNNQAPKHRLKILLQHQEKPVLFGKNKRSKGSLGTLLPLVEMKSRLKALIVLGTASNLIVSPKLFFTSHRPSEKLQRSSTKVFVTLRYCSPSCLHLIESERSS